MGERKREFANFRANGSSWWPQITRIWTIRSKYIELNDSIYEKKICIPRSWSSTLSFIPTSAPAPVPTSVSTSASVSASTSPISSILTNPIK